MKRERKSHLARSIAAITADGRRVEIEEHEAFFREQLPTGGWTDWLPDWGVLKWGNIHVNLLDDGNFETAEPTPRRLTRLP